MTCEKDLIDISIALLTPVVAVLGFYIAFQQWKINKQRLNHELFDKKYLMFDATKKFINTILVGATVKDEHRYEFLLQTKGAIFFFNSDIVDYLESVHKKSCELMLHKDTKNIKSEHELLLWFGAQLEEIDQIFKQAISVDK